MTEEATTHNPQHRQAAFKTDLFAEIDELEARLEDTRIEKIILAMLAIAQGAINAVLATIIYFSGSVI